jgi:asparagine synthase (glutamine-hydrolysing)
VQVASVAEKVDGISRTEIGCLAFEPSADIAVPDDRELETRLAFSRERQGFEEHVEALYRDDAADEDEQDVVVGKPQLGTKLPPQVRHILKRGERLEVETEGDNPEPVRRCDAEAHQIVHGSLADADQAVADPSQHPLQLQVQPGLGCAEVTLEDVAVVGVNDGWAGADCESCPAAKEAGLGRMGVDDVWSEAACDADEPEKGTQVPSWTHGLLQLGHEVHGRALLFRDVGQRCLACRDAAVNEERLVARGVEALPAEQSGLMGRAAHIQAADYPEDTEASRLCQAAIKSTHRARCIVARLVCGIAGKASLDADVPARLIEQMCEHQAHRGPDSRGVLTSGGIGLGIQRLRVIDLETGDQPVHNEDRSVAVVLNGEIYNFQELRRELQKRGHTFSTHSDTEVIAHLYEEHGVDLVKRLNGMFAFALWDERRRRLLIARDRVGKKPLFYSEQSGWLSFASELGALMADPDIPREVDMAAIDCYLAYGYIQAPRSIWRHVKKLPPGHMLVWEHGNTRVAGYWRLDYSQKTNAPLPELEEELRTQVAAAVRRRMISDVPLGALLSGGVDSSIVVSEMAAASPRPVKTFSIGFQQEEYNELPLARLTAQRFGTDHEEFTVQPHAIEIVPKLVRHYGEPYADSSAIPSFYLAELTRQHVTVALNGDGGDESFAGYLRHMANALSAGLDRAPRPARRAVARTGTRLLRARHSRSASGYLRRFLASIDGDGPTRYARQIGVFSPAERDRLLCEPLSPAIHSQTDDVIAAPWRKASGHSRLDILLETDVDTYLPGDLLVKMDIASMAYSLEARSPLLDPAVMQFAASLPARYKARLASKKWILRRAYRGRVPDEVLDGKKRGFGVPLGAWFRNELRDYTQEVLLDPKTLDRGLLREAPVRALLDQHNRGDADRSMQIWALLMLELWHREFVDRGSG